MTSHSEKGKKKQLHKKVHGNGSITASKSNLKSVQSVFQKYFTDRAFVIFDQVNLSFRIIEFQLSFALPFSKQGIWN